MRIFSKGANAIRVPTDLQGRSPYRWNQDRISPALFSVIGGVTSVPLSVHSLVTALRQGKVDVFSAPALAATQLQWTPHATHVSADPITVAIGALVFHKSGLKKLSKKQRQVLIRTGRVAGKLLTKTIRANDERAFDNLSMNKVTLTDAEKEQWKKVFDETFSRLKQGTFPADIMDELRRLSGT